jgi:dienelactone hydrolase
MSSFLILVGLACGLADPPDKWEPLKKSAHAFLDALKKEDFDAATKDFNADMKKGVPKEQLAELWKALNKQLGPFKGVGTPRTETVDKYDVVYLPCEFEKMKIDFRIVYDADKKIAGLRQQPAAPDVAYKPPAYVKTGSFREEEVKVNPGEWELPGTLTLPRGGGSFAGVVLVHGSGWEAGDRDESVGPNKPFRDLAWGLATQGVAVLRYEKRTKHHRDQIIKLNIPITLEEETVADALAAAKLLRERPEIDKKKVFIVGHSLGATAAPRMGQRDPELAGLILLAGGARRLEDAIVEQLEYALPLQGVEGDKLKEILDTAKKQVARVKDKDLNKATPASELPFGAPASYWLALREYDQKGTAAAIKQPMLILQGERDYQVTMVDFAEWKKTLEKRTNVTFKSYADLNHLFMTGKGKAKPQEVLQEGHVAEGVIGDIAAWIKKR